MNLTGKVNFGYLFSTTNILLIIFCTGCTSTRLIEHCSELRECHHKIFEIVSSNWQPPSGVDKNISALIRIQFDDDTFVKKVLIVESSGNTDFDKAAKLAVLKSSPFLELKGLQPSDYGMIRQFQFIFTAKN